MILKSYSVYDKAVGCYLPPFFVRSPGEALRSFTEACCNVEHQFFKYAADYVLFSVGEFDDNSGLFSHVEPVRVISALECVTATGGAEVLDPRESFPRMTTPIRKS